MGEEGYRGEVTPREPVIDAVLLAAGASRRFGAAKLLAAYGGATLLSTSLTRALAAPARTVWLVVGSGAEAVEAEARTTAATLGTAARLKVVHAEGWAEGMSASLRAGLTALSPDCEAAWIGLADMPRVPPDVDAQLITALRGGAFAAAPVVGGRRGHPVMLRRALFPDLLALTGDAGARRVLDALGPALALVPTNDRGVLEDVDTPDDLARLQNA